MARTHLLRRLLRASAKLALGVKGQQAPLGLFYSEETVSEVKALTRKP